MDEQHASEQRDDGQPLPKAKRRKKTKRRGRGEGGIFQRGDGLWVGQVTVGVKPDGKPRRKTVYGRTKDEATKKLDDLKRKLYLKRDVTGAEKPLRIVMEFYLGSVKVRCDEGTWMKQEQLAQKHIVPYLGHVPIGEVTPAIIQDWLASLESKGASCDLRRRCGRLLSRCLKYAVRYRYICENVAEMVDLPREENANAAVRAMDEEQVKLFLKAAEGHRLYALWLLALDSGARMGELLALEWADIDLSERILSITKTVKTNEKGGKVRVKSPKTKNARRRLRLTAQTVEALMKWKVKSGRGKLVFVARRYAGRPERHMLKSSLTKAFKLLLKKAGLPPFRFHDLRHTCATLALAKTRNIVAISRRLGHSGPDITLAVYAQWMPSFEEEVVSALGDLLKLQSSNSEPDSSSQVLAMKG